MIEHEPLELPAREGQAAGRRARDDLGDARKPVDDRHLAEEIAGAAQLQIVLGERALQDGYTTGRGMGMGLPGARRLVNEFALSSTPSEGTCVTIIRWKK